MGRRVGRVGQTVLLGCVADLVIDDAGLHPGAAAVRIERQNPVHVFREIKNDRDITGLAG